MLKTRRVFDILNSLMNYLLISQFTLFLIFIVSYFIEINPNFCKCLVLLVNILLWTMVSISIVLLVICLILASNDDYRYIAFFWNIIRIIIAFIITLFINLSLKLTTQGLSISL